VSKNIILVFTLPT